ncbi:DNA polymerase I, partial [Aeromicrobium phragmitis]
LRNRRLNALVCDLDLPAGPTDLGFTTEWNRDAIHRVFDALEFSALRERLFDYLGGGDEKASADAAVALDLALPGEGQVGAWLDEHAAAGTVVGVDVSGVLRPSGARADTIAVATADGHGMWVSTDALTVQDDA